MALSTAASTVGSPLMTAMVQTLGAIAGRGFAAGAASSKSSAPPKRPTSIAEPTYTYMPPGSSMREPLYFSMSDPVYFVDPKPETSTASPADGQSANTKADPHAPASLKKFDLSAITGRDDGRPVSYKMTDDFSQQGYIVDPNTHSMREPKYVSVSDPSYSDAKKKQ